MRFKDGVVVYKIIIMALAEARLDLGPRLVPVGQERVQDFRVILIPRLSYNDSKISILGNCIEMAPEALNLVRYERKNSIMRIGLHARFPSK